MTLDGQEAKTLMEMKLRCVNLVLCCPLDRDAAGCPFRKVRQEESVVTRVNWVKSLDATRLARLLARHDNCMAMSVVSAGAPARQGRK